MWKKKLIKKKFQFLIIGILILVGTSILTACVNVGIQVNDLTDKVYETNKADFYVKSTKGTSSILKDKVNKLETIKCYKLTDVDLSVENQSMKDINEKTYFIPIKNDKDVDWKIVPIEGDTDEEAPKEGEVWIERIIADAHDIKVGSEITVSNENKDKLIVSTLINDSMKPNTMADGQYIYMNEKDINKISGNEEIDFSLIYDDMSKDDLQNIISDNFTRNDKLYEILSMDDIKSAATLINGLVTGLGTITAICMIIITIVIIRFFIRSTIISEYAAIGTYKSLGYVSKEIIGFYSKCYCLVGSISSIVGALLGIVISNFMGNIITDYIAKYENSYSTILVVILSAVLVFSLLVISLKLAFRKINKITPVDALRVGTTSSKSKMKKSVIKNASSSFAMAVNDIFKYKTKSLLIVLVVTISFYLSLVFLNMCYSFETLDDKAAAWVGTPTSHCFVTVKNYDDEITDDINNYLEDSKYVDHFVVGTLNVNLPIESLQKNVSFKKASIMSFNTYEDGKYDINYATGRPPQNDDEIGMDNKTLENSGLSVGDYLKTKVNGKEESFLITGTFNTVGYSTAYHFLNSYFEDNNIKVKEGAAIFLKDKADFDDFKYDIESHFDKFEVKKITEYIGDVKNSIQAIMIPVTIMIISIFLFFTLLIIMNLIITNNKENEKNFGIMKAYGFTTRYILLRNVYKIAILSTIGVGIAVLLNKLITAKMFWMGLGCDGFNISIPYTISFVSGGLFIIILLTILLSICIRKISPRQLVEE